jgi:hypothetical protein
MKWMQNKGIMSVHFIYEITYVVLVQFVLTNYSVPFKIYPELQHYF